MHAAIIQRRDRLEEAQSTAVVATLVGGVLISAAQPRLRPAARRDLRQLGGHGAGGRGIRADPDPLALGRPQRDPAAPVLVPPDVRRRADRGRRLRRASRSTSPPTTLGPWAMLAGQYAGAVVATTLAWTFARWRPRRCARFVRDVEGARLLRPARSAVDDDHSASASRPPTPSSSADRSVRPRSASTATPSGSPPFRFYVMLAAAAYVIFPAFARIAAEPARLQAAFLRSLRWMAAIGIPAGMVLSRSVRRSPSSSSATSGWPAGSAAIAMCAYAGASCITSSVVELLKADGNPSGLTRINTLITLTTAAAMIAMIPFGLCRDRSRALDSGRSPEPPTRSDPRTGWSGSRYGRCSERSTRRRSLQRSWLRLVLPLDRLVLEPASHGTVVGLRSSRSRELAALAVYVGCVTPLAPGPAARDRRPVRNRDWRERDAARPTRHRRRSRITDHRLNEHPTPETRSATWSRVSLDLGDLRGPGDGRRRGGGVERRA